MHYLSFYREKSQIRSETRSWSLPRKVGHGQGMPCPRDDPRERRDTIRYLGHSIIRELCEKYATSDISVVKYAGGVSAENYVVRCGERELILKRYQGSVATSLRLEAVTIFLKNNGIPVVEPVESVTGDRHALIQGRMYALYPLVPGVTLHERSLTQNSLSKAAALLVKLHELRASSYLRLESSDQQRTDHSTAMRRLHRTMRKFQRKDSADLVTRLLTIKAKILTRLREAENMAVGSSTLIHGDYHNENLLFNSDGDVTALLDLEDVRTGHAVEDVVMFIMLACFNSGFGPSNVEKASHFIHAYRKKATLTREDLELGLVNYLHKACSSVFLEDRLTVQPKVASMIERDTQRLPTLAGQYRELADQLIA